MVWSLGPAFDLEWASMAAVSHVGSGVNAMSAASCVADLCTLQPSLRAMLTGCQT